MDYYDEIKNEFINNEIYKRVKDYSKNRSDLNTYYNVGKLLAEAGKHYGEGVIKDYSRRLTEDFGKDFGKGYIYSLNENEKILFFRKSCDIVAIFNLAPIYQMT